MALLPCPSCARHVRDDAAACPFCAATITRVGERGPRTIARVVDRRFARAALFLGASAIVAACGKDQSVEVKEPADSGPVAITAYGAPPIMMDAGTPEAVDAGGDTKDAGKDSGAKDAGKPPAKK